MYVKMFRGFEFTNVSIKQFPNEELSVLHDNNKPHEDIPNDRDWDRKVYWSFKWEN